jgi:hypothetical protein
MFTEKLVRFLAEISNDPTKADALRNDPGGYLAKSDLSDVEKDAVMSGDQERIREGLASSGLAALIVLVIFLT